MTVIAYRRRAAVAVLSLNLAVFSCSNAPGPPQKGTPAFYWSAAKETYAAGDYSKTIEHLEQLSSSENEYSIRARPWLLVMTSGIARGYMSLADTFEAGARARERDTAIFRRNANNYRTAASRAALQFAETFAKFQGNKDENVPLAFSYPAGSTAQIPALTKVANGMAPPGAELETIQKRSLSRGVLLEACRAVGAPDDPAKAQEVFKAASAQVPRAVFVMAMADSMHQQAQLYSRTKLDDPDKYKIFSTRALEALSTIPESKQTKELKLKIDASFKKAK